MQRKFIILGIIIIAFIVLGVWLGFMLNTLRGTELSKYSAVYLSTGDMYFGELDWFPHLHVKNAWYLQRTVNQQNQPQLGVLPFSGVFWGPSGDIYLNSKQIIFYTRLKADSQMAKALANPSLLQPQQPAEQQPQPQQPAPNTKK